MPINQSIRNAVSGVNLPTANATTDAKLAQLQAFHIWLRLQNQYDNKLELADNFVKLEALQSALRFINVVLLGPDSDAEKAQAKDFYRPANQMQANVDDLDSLLYDTVKDFDAEKQAIIDAEIVALNNAAGTLSNQAYAESLLADINTYIQRHGLSAITDNAAEQDKIYNQLETLNPPFSALKDGGINFLLRGMILSLTFPIALPFAALRGAYVSLKNAASDEPSDRHYGTQATEILNRKDERGRALNDILPSFNIGGQLGPYTIRGTQYGPYTIPAYNIRPVQFVLHLAEAGVNALTALVFEPIRYLFSYDSWQPQTKRRFDSIERGIFNVIASPVVLALGLVRAVVDTFNNSAALYAENDYDNTNLLDDQHSPYGLGMLRFFKWIDDSPNFKKYTGYALTFIFAPFVLGLAIVNRGLKASGRQPLTMPTMTGRAKILLAMMMSPILWPVDLFVGTLLHAARGFGQKVSDGFEKGFHKFMSQIWASMLLTTIGPMAWGGALAVIWTPFIEVANWFLHGISNGAVPMLKAGEVLAGIFKYTGGLGAKELFWGANGVLAVGANAFAAGMKTAFTAMFSAQAWAPLAGVFTGFSWNGLATAMKPIAYLAVPLAIGVIARGWDNMLTGVRSVFGNWGKPALPGVDAADKVAKFASLNTVNPAPVQTVTPPLPPPPPANNNGSSSNTNTNNNNNNNNNSSAPSKTMLPSSGGFTSRSNNSGQQSSTGVQSTIAGRGKPSTKKPWEK